MLLFLKQYDVVSSSQHGFMSGRSTVTNLFQCFDDWTRFLDLKCSLDVIYLDLEKAFDTVSHSKLIVKLRRLGLGAPLVNWLQDFLFGRRQCVKVENSFSHYRPVISGIPQGTILGPLLFLLYINDLPKVVKGMISLYADDSKLYQVTNSVSDCISLAEDVLNVQEYFSEWQLKLNIPTCGVLHMGSSGIEFPYRLNGFVTESGETCRDLGISVTSSLSVSSHCAKVFRLASFRLRQFFKTFTCCDRDFLLFLYITYIRPLVESSTPIWNPYLLSDINKIESVQRKFTKRLPGLRHFSYSERLHQLKLCSLETRRIHFDLILMYKIVHQIIDITFEKYFSYNTGSTRGHSLKLNVQYSRLDIRKYFFTNRVVRIWNFLAEDIVLATSLYSFKKKIQNVDFNEFCRGRAHTALD